MALLVALLRGINVGGKNKLPMAELRELAVSIGCIEPQTYIQSGNMVCGWPGDSEDLGPVLSAAIDSSMGLSVDVVVRDAAVFRGVARDNPFVLQGQDPAMLHLAFADHSAESSKPLADRVTLDFLPDEGRVVGPHLYLHLPNGLGRSRLGAAVARSTQPRYTVRNWRTVTKLTEMVEDF